MEIIHRYHNKILIVEIDSFDGKLVSEDIDEFLVELLKIYNGETKEIAFEMIKKTYLNSSGLGDLIKVKDKLMDSGVGLVLINPTNRVVSLLEMVGVDQFFNIVESEDELG